MGKFFPKPDPVRGGQNRPRRAFERNQILDALKTQLSGQSVTNIGDRALINPDDNGIGLNNLTRLFVIKYEWGDYLECLPYYFTEGNEQAYNEYLANEGPLSDPEMTIYVAKPIMLQQKMWNAKEVTIYGKRIRYDYAGFNQREATNVDVPTEKEVQRVVPPYFQGEIIIADEMLTQLVVNDLPVVYMDKNTAARVWATECA